jgi:hypothetical protein
MTAEVPHMDELLLYQTDRVTWARYVAPRWRDMLKKATQEGKRALWELAGPELRAAITELRQETPL